MAVWGQHDILGMVLLAQVVDHRQADGDEDSSLHAEEHDSQQRGHRYRERSFAKAGNLAQRTHVDQFDADQENDGGQRRVGQSLDQRRGEQRSTARVMTAVVTCAACVRPPAAATTAVLVGLPLTTKVLREPRQEVRGSQGEEIAVFVEVFPVLLGEGARGRGALRHDDQEHGGRRGEQALRLSPGNLR